MGTNAPAARPKTARGRIASRTEASTKQATVQEDMTNKLASTMEYIAEQMQIMTKTLTIFEQRLTRNEDTIAQILKNQRDIVSHQQSQSPVRIHRQVTADTDVSSW